MYNSYKKQQKLHESWRRYLNEQEQQLNLVEKAKEILSSNSSLSSLVNKFTNDSLVDIGKNMIFLYIKDETFKHTKKSHVVDSELPGSKFNKNFIKDETLLGLVKEIIKISPPPSPVVERGVKKLKWFNVELSKEVGLDSVVKKDDPYLNKADVKPYEYKEKIDNIKAIPAILSSGNTIIKDSNDKTITTKDIGNIDQTGGTSYFIVQQIEVVNAPMKPTKKVNLVLAELGVLGDKKFVSLMTIFPGEGAADLINKQDYIEAGYVFVTG